MRAFSRFALLLATTAVFPAMAQGNAAIAVRAGVQDGFVRLVFSAPVLPKANVDKTDTGKLRIHFEKAAGFKDLSGAAHGITPALTLTPDAAGGTLDVAVDGLSRFRTLALGNRLFVDIFTDKTPQQKTDAPPDKTASKTSDVPDAKPQAPTTAATSKPVTPPPATPPPATPSSASEQPPALPATPAAPVASAPVGVSTPSFMGSAIITIGASQGVGVAAFVRSGYFWIVLSQPNLSIQPVVSGPSAALVGALEPVKIDGGSGYRFKLPKGAYVRPEGASLVWRLYVEGKDPALGGIGVDRDFSDTAEGPKIHIAIPAAASVLRLHDDVAGDDLAVVTVNRSEQRVVSRDRYVDFDFLPAVVGVVLKPKADGMRVSVTPDTVDIARQGGLRMTATGPRQPVKASTPATPDTSVDAASLIPPSRMFNFTDWALGGPSMYLPMRRSIDERVASAKDEQKLSEMISGARFMLATGLPQEGIGFLQMAQSYMPMLGDSAEFQALRGAILGLAGQADDGLAALATQGLDANNDELNLWRAFMLAQQGKMPEAQKALPANAATLLAGYPDRIQAEMLPSLIDAVLTRGDVAVAARLVDLYDRAAAPDAFPDHDAAVSYYRGRIAQLRGDSSEAVDQYRAAAKATAGPYPSRAVLALIDRGLSDRTISRDDAIRKLESFRFGWRGDTLETDVLQRLGLIYVTGGEQRRGLTILREAATLAPDDATRAKLVAVMQKAFTELFSGKTKEKMTPMEAASVAADFSELMPTGKDGEAITLTIADQMQAIDLMDRAADLVDPLVDKTEKPDDALRYAEKVAVIRLTDQRPSDALAVVDRVMARPDVAALSPFPPADAKALTLLRAKAKAMQKKTDDALADLATLPEDVDTLRLKADIAWSAQRWPVAADALGKLVRLSNPDATKPPRAEQAQMLLNQALALNLSGNTNELDMLRIGYGDIMRRSDLYQAFQMVTRTAREARLADRTTLLKLVSEVDMFKSVLNDLRNNKTLQATPPAPATATPTASTPAAPTSVAPAANTVPASAPTTEGGGTPPAAAAAGTPATGKDAPAADGPKENNAKSTAPTEPGQADQKAQDGAATAPAKAGG